MTRTAPIPGTETPAPKRVTKADIAGDALLAAMLSNLRRAKEPLLVEKLAAAIARVQEARRRNP
jgi:hypothetical protein